MTYDNKQLKTDRSLFWYIILNMITLGVYNLYFIYSVSKDINMACYDDDRYTDGVVLYIILCFITFGLYSFVWGCLASNRIKNNFYKYSGAVCRIDAKNYIFWNTFGILLLGLGPIIAKYKFINAINDLNFAYNVKIFKGRSNNEV